MIVRWLGLIAMVALIVVGLGWLALSWFSMNLLSYPCSSPEVPESCDTVVPRDFTLYALIPTLVVWGLGGWFTLHTWRKRQDKKSIIKDIFE